MKYAYIMRHGVYESGDSLIPSSEEYVKQNARLIKSDLLDIEAITVFHSPAQRALVTANTVANELNGIRVTLEAKTELDFNKYEIGHFLEKQKETCIVVSHEPDIKRITGEKLVSGSYVRWNF